MIVSVIIPIYNASSLLERCLNSVFQQIGGFELEVICIDDGSTDNSVTIIEQYAKPVILLKQANQGPAAARNKGIEIATGKYLAFLDADDYWEPDFFAETVSFLEEHSDAIAVSVGQKHIVPGGKVSIVPASLNNKNNTFQEPVVLDNFFTFWTEHSHVCTGSVLIRTNIVKKTGGQRTELRITEDLEFWAYLATFGSFGFIPKVLFVSDGSRVTKQIGWLRKNRLRWASAPSVEEWEKRIIKTIDEKDKIQYRKARGKIAKNLCYSMIMSKRIGQAQKVCITYGHEFPEDKVARLLMIGSGNWLLWILAVAIIHARESLRVL